MDRPLLCLCLVLLFAMRPAPAVFAAPDDWAKPFCLEMERLRTEEGVCAPRREGRDLSARDFFEDLVLVQDLSQSVHDALTPPEQEQRERNRRWLLRQAEKRGDDPVTRIDALRALALAQGVDPTEADPGTGGFGDVHREQAPWVSHYTREGVVSGYTDGTFRPDAWLSRKEEAALVFGALYADARAARPVGQRLRPEELVQPAWLSEQSEWAFGLLARNAPSGLSLHDGPYPVGCGRLCLLRAPRIEEDGCDRRWIVLDMRYAHAMQSAFGIQLICQGGRRVRNRGPVREMHRAQEGTLSIFYPVAAKDDSYTRSDEGALQYHFEDDAWSRYQGDDIEGVVVHDPLFPDETLYVPWPR